MHAETLLPADVLASYPPHGHTLWSLLASRAATGAERTLLRCRDRRTSYADAIARASDFAEAVAARGLRKGDRVAVVSPNCEVYFLLLFALAKLGAVAVPVNPDLNASEAGYILRHAGVAAVACPPTLRENVRAACVVAEVSPLLVSILEETIDFDAPPSSEPNFEPVGPDDTWLTLYTSGTTGFPKGVMHSQRNFVVAGEGFVERMHLQPDDRLFVILPLFHINALFYSLGGALAAGASLLVVPKFSASQFWRTAAEGGATEVNLIGAVGSILIKRPRSEFVPDHRLRKVYGAGMTAETREVFEREFGVPTLVEGYGLTEVPGVCNNPFVGPHKPKSIGPPARHPDRSRSFSEMRVVDDDGREVADGEVGEIAVRSPIVMQGYYRDPEATAATFRDGWFMTGDLGYRDGDGYYFFVARKKDIIRRRGENVSGAEIDRVVGAHPKVQEAAAIAVPSELGEDEIAIVVVPRPGESVEPNEIAEWCAARLSPWKRPRFFASVDALPQTPTHRVAKFKLKQDPTLRQRMVELKQTS